MRPALLLTLALGAGCVPNDDGPSPEKEPEDTDTAAPDTDDTDTDEPDTDDTDTGVPDTGDTDTGVTDTDTGAPGDSGLCDPSPYLSRETGDTGQPPDVELMEPDTAGDTAYHTDQEDDCEVSVLSEGGHPLLGCMGTVMDLTLGRENTDFSHLLDQAEWLGDLDGDGSDDLVVRTTAGADFGTLASYVYYGGAELLNLGHVEGSGAAAAWTAALETRPLLGGGDFNGDGVGDVLIASASVGSESSQVGVLLGDGSRWAGEVTSWGDAAFWEDTDNAVRTTGDVETWPGGVLDGGDPRTVYRRANVADLDADGFSDLVFSQDLGTEGGGIVVVRGESGLAPAGRLVDAGTWVLENVEQCTYYDSHSGAWRETECWRQMGVPLGDMDGDGDRELGITSVPTDKSRMVDNRFEFVDVAELGACHYAADAVYQARLTAPMFDEYREFTYDDDRTTNAMHPAGDLDGDGRDDALVVGTMETSSGSTSAIWFIYGGEEWERFGGALLGNPDRIEIPYQSPTHDGRTLLRNNVNHLDIDGDGSDEILLGGTYRPLGLEPSDARSVLDIIDSPAGGLRGVMTDESAVTLALIGEEGGRYLLPAVGRGDADGDDLEDVFLTELGYLWTYDRYDNPVDNYPVETTYLATGAEVVPFLP